jgi:glycosyltransferase involved in cell wall biosynthesis
LPIRTICHIRDLRFTKFTLLITKYANKTTEFIAISEETKRRISNIMRKRELKIEVIYDGENTELYHPDTPTDVFERDFPPNKNKLKIGIIGRINEWKRHIDVIEAAGLLTNRLDLQVFIVGELWECPTSEFWKKLQSRIITLGLSDRVVFTGFRSDIPEIMAGLDIIIVPSENEPFGMVTVEAMAMGKPVIGTLSGATPEIIQHGLNGLLVPVKSPEALANAIETLASDRDYAKSLGFNARRRVLEAFSLDAYIRNIQELYLQGTRNSINPDPAGELLQTPWREPS